jgi:hypothetical protein
MGRATHPVEAKAVIRIEVAVSPCSCLGCAAELVLRITPLRRGVPTRQRVVKVVEEHVRLCLLGCHHHPLPQQSNHESRSCTPLAATWLVMKYHRRFARPRPASSASAGPCMSCSNPGPSSLYWPKASGFTPPSPLIER